MLLDVEQRVVWFMIVGKERGRADTSGVAPVTSRNRSTDITKIINVTIVIIIGIIIVIVIIIIIIGIIIVIVVIIIIIGIVIVIISVHHVRHRRH